MKTFNLVKKSQSMLFFFASATGFFFLCAGNLWAECTFSDVPPYTFQSSQLALAAEINENFDCLYQTVDPLQSSISVDPNGNVGIGTTNPVTLLEVREDQNATTTLSVTNTQSGTSSHAELRLFTNGSSTNSGGDTQVSFMTGSHFGDWGIGVDRSAGGVFKISGGINVGDDQYSLGTNDRLTIDPDGNVGIGTTTPMQKLSVWGSIRHARGPLVTSVGSFAKSGGDTQTIFTARSIKIGWGPITRIIEMFLTNGGGQGGYYKGILLSAPGNPSSFTLTPIDSVGTVPTLTD